jgi:mannose-6-phosphate isomerase-like protein (cupin superfamily)
MRQALLLSVALALTPIVVTAQVPGMVMPADPYKASSPLSRTHVPLAERIAHTDPAKFRLQPSVHSGSGPMRYMALFDGGKNTAKANLGVNLWFLHRGELLPGGGIGEHFHNFCEEMFVIFDGEAEFTVDSRTSTLQGPAGAVNRMGHSHAITNPSGKSLQWMNINVGLLPSFYDAFDLADARVGAPKDPKPQFINMSLATGLDRPVDNFDGGKGTAMYHRGVGPTNFYSTWSYVDHLLLPPGVTAGPAAKPDMAEVYYVMSGRGTATIQGETVAIQTGDAVPAALGESRAFAASGDSPLEFMIIGIARDQESKKAYMLSAENAARPTRR